MNEKEKKFKKSILLKRIGFIVIMLSAISSTLFYSCRSFILLIITLIILAIGVLLITKFRCPYCNYLFDSRLRLSELKHCPNCGEKLPEYKRNENK